MPTSTAKKIASRIIQSVLKASTVIVAIFGFVQEAEANQEPNIEIDWVNSFKYSALIIADQSVDDDGFVYVAGFFGGTADFDPGPAVYNMTARGTMDAFILKLDPTGQLIWAQSFGMPTGISRITSIAVNNNGDIYLGGFLENRNTYVTDQDTYNFPSNCFFVIKMNSYGEAIWAKAIKGDISILKNNNDGLEIALDENEDIYLAGATRGFVDFDPGPEELFLSGAPDSKYLGYLFIVKLNPMGELLWAKTPQVVPNFGSVKLDIGNNIHVLANTSSTKSLLKLDLEGNSIWSVTHEFDPWRFITMNTMVVDRAGNVYTTGKYKGGRDLDPGPGVYQLPHYGGGVSWPYISKFDSEGKFVWAKSIESGSNESNITSTAVDFDGNVYVAGNYWENRIGYDVDFDPGPNKYTIPNKLPNGYILKLDSQGRFIWVETLGGRDAGLYFIGGSDGNFRSGLWFARKYVDDNIYLRGHFYGYIDFGLESSDESQSSGRFLMKLSRIPENSSPEFDLTFSNVFKEGSETSISDIASDPDGDDITITVVDPPAGLTIDGTTLIWTPGYDQAGVYEIELTADDGKGGIATATLTITVENTNRPPVANAGADIAAECAGVPTAAQLDGSGSSDPDGDEITYAWSADGIEFDDASAAITTGYFPLGETTVTLTVSDEEPLSDSDETVVTIVDTTPPTIDYTQTVTELWPPNHNMATAIEGISATDACGGDIVLNVTVSSDEDGMGGAGNTEEDWDVITADDGSQSVALRAERSGNGDGREYTVVVTATDASGNSTEQMLTVAVPLSKGKGRGKEVATPLTTALYDNYPNPFNAETVIRFELADAGPVRLDIFDITGRRIRTLVDQFYNAGSIEIVWDSRDNAGNEVASGVYVYRLQTAQSSFSKRLMLLR